MKVLEDGTSKEIRCPNCKSRLQVVRTDVQYNYSMGHHSYFYVTCGVCARDIEIQPKDFTEWGPYLQTLLPDDD